MIPVPGWHLSRVALTPSGLERPSDFNIWAGSKPHGLRASTWSRFLVKGPGLNRASSMELFDARLRDDTSAMNGLGLLRGVRLACHCEPSQRCHGDVLVHLFRELRSARQGLLAFPFHLLPLRTDKKKEAPLVPPVYTSVGVTGW